MSHEAGELLIEPVSVIVFCPFARREAGANSHLDVLFVRPEDVSDDDEAWAKAVDHWRAAIVRASGNDVEVLKVGAGEVPARVYDGTSTQKLVDPPDMAWTWFLSHNDELWMTGFRDVGTIGPVVERGIYRWDDSLGRVSITIGTPLDGVSTGELLARGDR